MQRQQRRSVAGQLDGQIDPALHGQLVAHQPEQGLPGKTEIDRPQPILGIDPLDHRQPQPVQGGGLHPVMEGFKKGGHILGRRQPEMGGGQFGHPAPQPLQAGGVLHRQHHAAVGQEAIGQGLFPGG